MKDTVFIIIIILFIIIEYKIQENTRMGIVINMLPLTVRIIHTLPNMHSLQIAG